MKISLAAPAALASVSLPVSIAVSYPTTAVIWIGIAVLATVAIVVWHLRHGGRATIKKTSKGQISFTLDWAPKRRLQGEAMATGYHNVRSYYRSDGTRVRSHARRNPSRPISVTGVILLIVLLSWLNALGHGRAGTAGTSNPSAHHSRVVMAKP